MSRRRGAAMGAGLMLLATSCGGAPEPVPAGRRGDLRHVVPGERRRTRLSLRHRPHPATVLPRRVPRLRGTHREGGGREGDDRYRGRLRRQVATPGSLTGRDRTSRAAAPARRPTAWRATPRATSGPSAQRPSASSPPASRTCSSDASSTRSSTGLGLRLRPGLRSPRLRCAGSLSPRGLLLGHGGSATTSACEGHARRSVALHGVDRVALDPAAMTVVALDLRPALAHAEEAQRGAGLRLEVAPCRRSTARTGPRPGRGRPRPRRAAGRPSRGGRTPRRRGRRERLPRAPPRATSRGARRAGIVRRRAAPSGATRRTRRPGAACRSTTTRRAEKGRASTRARAAASCPAGGRR